MSRLPLTINGFATIPVEAGVVLSDTDVTSAMMRYPLDPDRTCIIVPGAGLSGSGEAAVHTVLSALAFDGEHAVRLVASTIDAMSARRLAADTGTDLVAADGFLVECPGGLAVTGFDEDAPESFWQWHRYPPGLPSQPLGAVFPTPNWEPVLDAIIEGEPAMRAVAYRIAAGLAIRPVSERNLAYQRQAAFLLPDPSQVTVAVPDIDGSTDLVASVETVLAMLSARLDVVRLNWSHAAQGGADSSAQVLAGRHRIRIIAADARVHTTRSGSLLCMSGSHMGSWFVLDPVREPRKLGPLHPQPWWSRRVETMRHHSFAGDLYAEAIAAGIWIRRSGAVDPVARRQVRALPPDHARITVVCGHADGIVPDHIEPAIEACLADLGDIEGRGVHLLLSGAGAETRGAPSYGWRLSDRFGVDVGCPTSTWRFTRDGRVAIGAGASARAAQPMWATFSPAETRAPEPVAPLTISGWAAAEQPARSPQAPPAEQPTWALPPMSTREPATWSTESVEPEPAWVTTRRERIEPTTTSWPDSSAPIADMPPPAPAVTEQPRPGMAALYVRPLPRGRRSTDQDRRTVRAALESRLDGHTVTMGKVITTRPVLRAAATGSARPVIAAELACARAYLLGDLDGVDQALRCGTDPTVIPAAVCIAAGLAHLPSWRGPLFLTADHIGQLPSAYRIGEQLIEPAFVTATLAPPRASEGVRFAIWSDTARRAEWLGTPGTDRAVFLTGTRFTVLQTAPVDSGGWVYLREVREQGGQDNRANAERLIDRLRTKATLEEGAGGDGVHLPDGWLLGLNDDGAVFIDDTIAVGA